MAIVALHWAEIPARIPLHFGVSGTPDRSGDKTGLLLLPLTAIGLYILLTAASRYQRLINVPIAVDRDLPEVQRLLLNMSITLKTVLLLVFVYIVSRNVDTALGRADGLGKQFLPVFLLTIFLPVTVYLMKLSRYRK